MTSVCNLKVSDYFSILHRCRAPPTRIATNIDYDHFADDTTVVFVEKKMVEKGIHASCDHQYSTVIVSYWDQKGQVNEAVIKFVSILELPVTIDG